MNVLWQDIVFGLRMLAKKPVFTIVAALSLALGIGLNTAIFALINTILLGSLPFREPDRVVAIWSVPPGHPDQLNGASVPDYLAWKQRSRSFEGIGAMVNIARDFGTEQNGIPPERIRGEMFTPEMLAMLGVQPLMGRLFTPSEAEVDHPAPVIVISYRLWQQRFGGDKNILNRTVLIDGVNTRIIGIMRPNFLFSDDKADFLFPFSFNRFQVRGSGRFMLVAGRLKPGVSMRQAQSEMESVAALFSKEHPADMDHGKPWSVQLQPVRDALFGFMNRPLAMLQGAVAFVLLIACANVAALLLARAAGRRNEVAIRATLGAGRIRIFRQFLTESLLLSIGSGALGVGFAWLSVRALVSMAPAWFPRLLEISIGGRVLAFSMAISIFTGIVFGLAPIAQAWKISLTDTLKDSIRGGTSGGARKRLLRALVTAQLALALVLLIGSGLLIRSFLKLQGAGLNCDPAGLLTFVVQFSERRYGTPSGQYNGTPLWDINPAAAATFQQLYEHVQTVPGVQYAAASVLPPMTGGVPLEFTIEGRAAAGSDVPTANYTPVTPNFFQTMKIQVRRGRDFTMHDTTGSNWVMIVNETMARRFWPNDDPIGKRVRLDLSPDDRPREIVGVVHDTPSNPLQTKQDPEMYVPFFQAPPHIIGPWTGFRFTLTYLLRTKGDPMKLLPAVRRATAEIDANLPLVDPKTEEQLLSGQVEYPRYYSMLVGLFAFVATLLAAVGVYGVMSYAVEQRTREIGIRMALGASQGHVLSMVVRQAAWLIAGGLALGLGGAFALTRFLSSELWEVQSTADPTIFASVSVVLAAVAAFACLIPTWRAAQVDPTIALHYE
jgi:putative ABC transport system permease protein